MRTATLNAECIGQIADRLTSAVELRKPIPPIRHLFSPNDIDGAYAVQSELTRRRIAAGGRVIGRKIGLTSAPVQRQLGVDQPDFGVLFADMDVTGLAEVPWNRLLQPKIEAEIAFVLKSDLYAAQARDSESVMAAVDYAVAALEIVDSRVQDWNIALTDTVADNASSALFVLSEHRLPLSDFIPREVPMTMYVDGQEVSSGNGELCLGDPLDALAWLARTAADYGDPLRAGQVVLSGALGAMVPAQPGTRVHADLGPLGLVRASFSEVS
ncbi:MULTISPECIES: 2-keto-4-pentenoate hydratase [Mycobacteriaceae]|uniref:2-keto-4-pentenoate hydratase n=1 Tax=Mycolicibacterium neoaurum VKM Ac-1815D TaxID=700508 RepID=V5XEP7_MYCNE|nr:MULTISPECIES: fumarylacetoacetate hydrolase family protein [Mycobacteriaceae]AHC26146.1 2-keto-4-pentenoate hydratase [Mycolicibacterium neoaurum VKM Ac-1815D]AMO06533.1 2-keto-4-pentenoate hydratase [Mycolicibacterium neoaurum]AXK75113.1 4-oxalocrotonate decarboxylase [Mycolicibacterium neoaurum]KJQ51188.1 2-keto-4-pentenoate hydratase [Mycolicibacterium neoaurum]KUM07896.1 2-keto-4-pentenoate hydratase [Mycolicibacterium neoaurum]